MAEIAKIMEYYCLNYEPGNRPLVDESLFAAVMYRFNEIKMKSPKKYMTKDVFLTEKPAPENP